MLHFMYCIGGSHYLMSGPAVVTRIASFPFAYNRDLLFQSPGREKVFGTSSNRFEVTVMI
jgi:hypothetical protein